MIANEVEESFGEAKIGMEKSKKANFDIMSGEDLKPPVSSGVKPYTFTND